MHWAPTYPICWLVLLGQRLRGPLRCAFAWLLCTYENQWVHEKLNFVRPIGGMTGNPWTLCAELYYKFMILTTFPCSDLWATTGNCPMVFSPFYYFDFSSSVFEKIVPKGKGLKGLEIFFKNISSEIVWFLKLFLKREKWQAFHLFSLCVKTKKIYRKLYLIRGFLHAWVRVRSI